MQAYAIANKDGTVKHVAVWHRNAVGPSPLCNQSGARPLVDVEASRVGADPREIDRPWCSRCELTVEAMVRAISMRIPEVSS